MTPTAFRASLRTLGLSQVAAAKVLEVNDRTVRRWAAGKAPIPGAVRQLLERMEKDQ